jgi:hypothetical protein
MRLFRRELLFFQGGAAGVGEPDLAALPAA